MSLNTPAWQIVFEALKPEPETDKLVAFAASHLDEDELLTLCRDHGILLIVNKSLQGIQRHFFSADGLAQWRTAVASHTLNGLTMHRELQRLLVRFADVDISAVSFKGPTLSEQLYGDPALRMFVDLDLLVPSEQVKFAVDLLIEEGYQPTYKPDQLHRWLRPGSQGYHCTLQHPSGRWMVEVHWTVFSSWRRSLPPTPAMDEWLKLGKGNTLEALLYLCSHGAQHWWWQLKWVVDVDRCVRSAQNLDWSDLFLRAEERGCLRVVRLALKLAQQTCGLELPDEIAADINKDRSVAILAKRVSRFWPRPRTSHPSLFWKLRYLLDCRERLSDKVGMVVGYPLERGV